jgi:hypothetical protein
MLSPMTRIALLILVVASASAAEPQIDQRAASKQYVDLRKKYAERFSSGWVSDPAREALLKLYETDKKAFLGKSKHWLEHCPVDAKVQLMRASLLTEPSQAAEQQYHRGMFYGLLGSITSSGDGKSCKTAYYVINVDEEYTVLNYMGAKTLGQSLEGGCDVLDVELKGKRTKIYFDISGSLAATQERLDRANGH